MRPNHGPNYPKTKLILSADQLAALNTAQNATPLLPDEMVGPLDFPPVEKRSDNASLPIRATPL